MYGADRGINLTKEDLTLGLISKDSGGTSNSISVWKKAEIFTPSLPQSPERCEAQILLATSFCTKNYKFEFKHIKTNLETIIDHM